MTAGFTDLIGPVSMYVRSRPPRDPLRAACATGNPHKPAELGLGRLATRCGPQVLAGDRVEPQLAPERGDLIHCRDSHRVPRVALRSAADLANLAGRLMLHNLDHRINHIALNRQMLDSLAKHVARDRKSTRLNSRH